MAKFRLKRSILPVSLILIAFSGCGYRFISPECRNIFLRPVLNSTIQPRIDICLSGELKKTLIEYPEFSVVNSEDAADCVMQVNIKKWERLPLFFSKEGDDEIVIAKFRIEAEIVISGPSLDTSAETIADTFSASLATEYNEDEVHQKISRKLAEKIYFHLMEKQ